MDVDDLRTFVEVADAGGSRPPHAASTWRSRLSAGGFCGWRPSSEHNSSPYYPGRGPDRGGHDVPGTCGTDLHGGRRRAGGGRGWRRAPRPPAGCRTLHVRPDALRAGHRGADPSPSPTAYQLPLQRPLRRSRHRGFDCGIRVGYLADSNLVARRIGSFSVRLFASPDYVATYGAPETPEDVPGHPAVMIATETWTFSAGGKPFRSARRPLPGRQRGGHRGGDGRGCGYRRAARCHRGTLRRSRDPDTGHAALCASLHRDVRRAPTGAALLAQGSGAHRPADRAVRPIRPPCSDRCRPGKRSGGVPVSGRRVPEVAASGPSHGTASSSCRVAPKRDHPHRRRAPCPTRD